MAKYINVDMAKKALDEGLDIWWWNSAYGKWETQTMSVLTHQLNGSDVFAIGEKPTSPPRKMIEIDGVRMPAPIMRAEDLPDKPFIAFSDGSVNSHPYHVVDAHITAGNAFATEADAIAARDAWLLIKQRAMERAK